MKYYLIFKKDYQSWINVTGTDCKYLLERKPRKKTIEKLAKVSAYKGNNHYMLFSYTNFYDESTFTVLENKGY